MAERLDEPMPMPEFQGLEYLWQAFHDMGRIRRTAMGDEEMDWPGILAFAQATGAIDEPWEFFCLHEMSRGYLAERHLGARTFAMSPMQQAETDD